MRKTYFLVITSAVVVAGQIAKAGDLVELTEAEARNFLDRGKARLATAEDGAPEGEPEAADLDADLDLDPPAPAAEPAAEPKAKAEPKPADTAKGDKPADTAEA